MRSAVATSAAVLAVALLGAPGPAAATVPSLPGYGVEISQLLLDGDGDPSLVANTEASGGAVAWRVCAPECGAVVSTDRVLRPGPTPAGTTFEVSTTVGDATRTARSPAWGGRVALTGPPTTAGDLRIGRPVTAVAGTWSGGWPGDGDLLELRACPTAAGTDCRTLSYGSTAVVDPAYAGWYVGAIDRRYGPNPVLPAAAIVPPRFGTVSGVGALAASATVAHGPLVGPVPAARPGTPPAVVGRLAAGRTVRAAAGTWPDAPDDGLVATGLRSCPTRRDGPGCRVIAQAGDAEVAAGARGRAALGDGQLGRFVGAFEVHGRRAIGAFGFPPSTAAPDAVPVAGPAVVLGPLAKDPVRLATTPRVALRPTAATRGTRLTLGRVRCSGRCVVRLTVRGGGRTLTRRIAGSGTIAVEVRRSVLPRRATRVRARVRVDHSTVDVRRTVRVR